MNDQALRYKSLLADYKASWSYHSRSRVAADDPLLTEDERKLVESYKDAEHYIDQRLDDLDKETAREKNASLIASLSVAWGRDYARVTHLRLQRNQWYDLYYAIDQLARPVRHYPEMAKHIGMTRIAQDAAVKFGPFPYEDELHALESKWANSVHQVNGIVGDRAAQVNHEYATRRRDSREAITKDFWAEQTWLVGEYNRIKREVYARRESQLSKWVSAICVAMEGIVAWEEESDA